MNCWRKPPHRAPTNGSGAVREASRGHRPPHNRPRSPGQSGPVRTGQGPCPTGRSQAVQGTARSGGRLLSRTAAFRRCAAGSVHVRHAEGLRRGRRVSAREWIADHAYTARTLTAGRVTELEQLGMVGSEQEAAWADGTAVPRPRRTPTTQRRTDLDELGMRRLRGDGL